MVIYKSHLLIKILLVKNRLIIMPYKVKKVNYKVKNDHLI